MSTRILSPLTLSGRYLASPRMIFTHRTSNVDISYVVFTIRLFWVVLNVAPAATLSPFPRLQLFQLALPLQHWRFRSFQVALPLQRWPRSRASVLPNRAPAAALVSFPFSVLASFPRFCPSKSCSRCSAGLISVGPGLIPAFRSFQSLLPCNAILRWLPLCDVMPCAAML